MIVYESDSFVWALISLCVCKDEDLCLPQASGVKLRMARAATPRGVGSLGPLTILHTVP